MTPADIIILSSIGIVVVLVILNAIKKTREGKCAGCSQAEAKPKWLKDYKRDL